MEIVGASTSRKTDCEFFHRTTVPTALFCEKTQFTFPSRVGVSEADIRGMVMFENSIWFHLIKKIAK